MAWRRGRSVRDDPARGENRLCYPAPVKKLLLIFLMLLLPVQYTWSAAAVYCQHEQNAPSHLGHHAHQHKATANEAKEPGKVKMADADCAYCHLFSHAFFVPFDTPPIATPAPRHAALPAPGYSSVIPGRPPRPNWVRVA